MVKLSAAKAKGTETAKFTEGKKKRVKVKVDQQ